MRDYKLTDADEPTDAELSLLMKEVAEEATASAKKVHEELRKKVAEEIRLANEKYKAEKENL